MRKEADTWHPHYPRYWPAVVVDQDLGIGQPPNLPFRSSSDDDAAARLAQQCRAAGVFFRLTSRSVSGNQPADSPTQMSTMPARNPLDVLCEDKPDRGLGL